MASVANVTIHASQFPEAVRRDLIESLRTRQVNHKFHYDSVKQTHQWLALHQAYSPSRTDADCAAIYDRGFAAAAERIGKRRTHLIGLGCGGGQKDTRLLKLLQAAGAEVSYTPADVSVAMTLVAREAASSVVTEDRCSPLVCDLATATDLAAVLDKLAPPEATRLITCFGMMPNFEPDVILSRLAGLMRAGDWLLLSANLAPGPDYAAGVESILPLYDNALTREWLMTFLLNLGIEREDGRMRFGIEQDASGLKRVAAHFAFARNCAIHAEGERFDFRAGDSVRLFFSYRHTPELVRQLLRTHGVELLAEWVSASGEEGVFLGRRS